MEHVIYMDRRFIKKNTRMVLMAYRKEIEVPGLLSLRFYARLSGIFALYGKEQQGLLLFSTPSNLQKQLLIPVRRVHPIMTDSLRQKNRAIFATDEKEDGEVPWQPKRARNWKRWIHPRKCVWELTLP
jgi:hypothetical protein